MSKITIEITIEIGLKIDIVGLTMLITSNKLFTECSEMFIFTIEIVSLIIITAAR